jgi:hypothetical protein
MPYRADISRDNPSCLLMLIDQSTSMRDRIAGGSSKAQFLADVVNKTLYSLAINCSKSDGTRDYFDIGVIAYSGKDARNAFHGTLRSKVLHPISVIAADPLRIEERVKKTSGDNVVVKFPVWIDPRNQGWTSMCAGLRLAADTVRDWCAIHPTSYPPTILHVTDGHPTDGDPETLAQLLSTVCTEDGSCLLFNLHIDVGAGSPIVFPSEEGGLVDRYAKTLFRMSSPLPTTALASATAKGFSVRQGARGFIFNASPEAIVDFFEIGTRPAISMDR